MKKKFIDFYMQIAEHTSRLSVATRLKVGSVIVKDNNILGYGYNGTPSGWDNNCETKVYDLSRDFNGNYFPDLENEYPFTDSIGRYKLVTKPEVLHSEMNAIMKVSKSNMSTEGATIFCTHAPCIHCAKAIYQSGINQLFYRDTYRDTSGLDFLNKSGIQIEKYE